MAWITFHDTAENTLLEGSTNASLLVAAKTSPGLYYIVYYLLRHDVLDTTNSGVTALIPHMPARYRHRLNAHVAGRVTIPGALSYERMMRHTFTDDMLMAMLEDYEHFPNDIYNLILKHCATDFARRHVKFYTGLYHKLSWSRHVDLMTVHPELIAPFMSINTYPNLNFATCNASYALWNIYLTRRTHVVSDDDEGRDTCAQPIPRSSHEASAWWFEMDRQRKARLNLHVLHCDNRDLNTYDGTLQCDGLQKKAKWAKQASFATARTLPPVDPDVLETEFGKAVLSPAICDPKHMRDWQVELQHSYDEASGMDRQQHPSRIPDGMLIGVDDGPHLMERIAQEMTDERVAQGTGGTPGPVALAARAMSDERYGLKRDAEGNVSAVFPPE